MFDIEDYAYELPPELIAQEPVPKRDHSRLLAVDRAKRSFSDCFFYDLPSLLREGDLLVVNDTEVVPARLFGRKETGGRVEVLVLEHPEPGKDPGDTRACLVKASKRPKPGVKLLFESGVRAEVLEALADGVVKVRFKGPRSVDELIEEKGRMPLPPYIKRNDTTRDARLDRTRYQTVFSSKRGAVAAPTAGLHFSSELLGRLYEGGIGIASLTLHVGHQTFRPVRTRDIRDHRLGEETYRIGPEAAEAIAATREAGGKVVAVGTTVVRALESAADKSGGLPPKQGRTDLLITPGFSFRVVDALVTNFHLPRSSLLFLVAAFSGLELTKAAYRWAVKRRYRFYSYGDAMLIL